MATRFLMRLGGGCDGMCVDAKGNLFLALRSLKRPGILVTTSTGKEIAHIPTGEPNQKEGPGEEPGEGPGEEPGAGPGEGPGEEPMES